MIRSIFAVLTYQNQLAEKHENMRELTFPIKPSTPTRSIINHQGGVGITGEILNSTIRGSDVRRKNTVYQLRYVVSHADAHSVLFCSASILLGVLRDQCLRVCFLRPFSMHLVSYSDRHILRAIGKRAQVYHSWLLLSRVYLVTVQGKPLSWTCLLPEGTLEIHTSYIRTFCQQRPQ